nr:integrase, catalytic region, zinc finger, CCHC-type, peptidase aspartic, catalytic [Tanacetum cinerariifolium]
VGIKLQAEEYDLMAATTDLDEIKKVNANCILMANLQQASTSGTQTDSAPIYDTDGSAEVHENCNDNTIFNMFTQQEQYTKLLELIPESHQVPQNDNDVISEDTSVEQGGETVEKHHANFEETRALYESLYQNLAIEVEKVNSVNRKLKETNADLTTELARFKNQERCFEINQEKYDKLERCYQQSVYQEQCLFKKINALYLIIDSFYHTEHKMALGYQNPFYLKQAQKKQQSLYDGKVLLEKHDPPVVHDSEETLRLAQESHDKMKQMNKEIKPANYTKINHLSGVFVPQTALSHEELYFSNNSKTTIASKLFSIPNEDLSDDTSPSVARKFLNEVKSTIVTLQRAVKQKMTIETHNWSSSAHQELHKIVRYENFPLVNQVDARLQNFKIQFLKEAAKFVGDIKSLANEADASLAKHKALELEIERLLKAVVSLDIIIIVQNESVVDTSNLQTELELISNSFSTPQESKGVNNDKVIAPGMFRINPSKTSREEKHVPNIVSASARTKPITVSQPHVITKKDVNYDLNGLSSTGKQKAKIFVKEIQKKYQPKIKKPKKVGTLERLATPKPRKPRFLLRWSPTGRLFDQKGKLAASSNSESQYDCSNGDNDCTSNAMEPKNKRFPNSTSLLDRNDHVATILGFGDLQWGNILITRVYFVEGLGHNLFSVGQVCDYDFEVAFRRDACFVRNLEGVDLLKGDRLTNLYTINLHEMA